MKTCLKFILILVFPVFFLVQNSSAQLWYITRGLSTNEVAWGVDVDSEGNIYWAVEEKDQWPYWYFNILLFKIDSDARQVWQSDSFGGAFNEIAFKVTVKDSAVYLSGRADSTGNPASGDALVLSYKIINGGFNWQYTYNPVPDFGYEEIDGLIVQPDGIYLSGWTKGQNTDEDFLIQKISLTGHLDWTNSWDYGDLGNFDGANGHMALDDNFIYAAGHVNLLDGSLVCFSRANGAYQWDVTWSGSANDEVLGLTMSSDSMLYTIGYYSQGSSQSCLKKFSRTGDLKWTRTWGGSGTEDSRSLVADGDSIIYVIGTTSSYGNGLKDIFILKYDTEGTLIDSLFWGGTYNEVAKDVAMSGDYLYITGETESYGNGQIIGDHTADGLLLKVNGRTMQAPDSTMTNVSLSFSGNQNSVEIYPNPFSTSATIQIKDEQFRHYELKIYDLTGNIVFEKKLTFAAETLNLNLPGGMYFYRVTNDQQLFSAGKFLVH
jgi:hypothetical protein